MQSSAFTVIYDACVLYPAPLCVDEFLDILLKQGMVKTVKALGQFKAVL